MKLKKQRIGPRISLMLLARGIVLLAAGGWESRGHRLRPWLELGLAALVAGFVVGLSTQRCPLCGRSLGGRFRQDLCAKLFAGSG